MNRNIYRPAAVASALLVLASCGDPDQEIAGPEQRTVPAQAALTLSDAVVVMSGLDNPRGLAFGLDGALYVAEAGRGGAGPCFIATVNCYGPTGAISRLRAGQQTRVVTGLPSWAAPNGRAEGPNDIALVGMRDAYVTIGLEQDPAIRTQAPEFAGYGRVVHVSAIAAVSPQEQLPTSHRWQFVADLGAYEIAMNPDCGRIDSNPFSLIAEAEGLLIVDAGANALVRRSGTGTLSTFAAFPSRYSTPQGPECPELPADYPLTQPTETVPTSVAIGPDGAYYVGQLAGFPVVSGAASIFRVEPGSAPTTFLTGFTFIISIAFDESGNLYVLQHLDAPGMPQTGSLIRVAPNGGRTTLISGLSRATAVAVGPDGGVYISHKGTSAGTGEVLRIAP
jgi:hypothetical protein